MGPEDWPTALDRADVDLGIVVWMQLQIVGFYNVG